MHTTSDWDEIPDDEWDSLRTHSELEHLTFAQAVGRNLRRVRLDSGATLDDVASGGRAIGLKWTTARIVELEKGQRVLSVANLVSLALVLSEVAQTEVRLGDLVKGRYLVEVSPSISLYGEEAGALFEGSPGLLKGAVLTLPETYQADSESVLRYIPDATADEILEVSMAGPDLSEERVARSLEVGVHALRVLAHRLWGRGLSEERNSRVEEGSSPQARGRVTRQLVDELRTGLAEVHRGND